MSTGRRASRRDRLVREISELREAAFPAPLGTADDLALAALEMERDSVARARVLLDCALIEELTALIIMDDLLSDSPRWRQLEYFGRIRKYRLFYDEALGRLPARQKMTLVKKIARPPKWVAATVARMLALRDVLAHVLTIHPEADSIKYKGQSVFTRQGLGTYIEDSTACIRWFIRKAHVLSH